MTSGEIEFAERLALNLFDKWIDVTEAIPKFTTYYYECQGVIVDAVHCGIQMALNKNINIDENGELAKGD